jgi:hypothetical protein
MPEFSVSNEHQVPLSPDEGAADATSALGRRRLVEIRCGFAEMATHEAEASDARAALARQRSDAQLAVLSEAMAAADPASDWAAKEAAHKAFKASVRAARDRAGVEAAALAWLTEINRINGRLRDAQVRLRREHESTDAMLAERDRLMVAADAARTMAEAAREACLAARRALTTEEAEPAEEAQAGAPGSETASVGKTLPGAQGAPESASVAEMPFIAAAEMAAAGSEAPAEMTGFEGGATAETASGGPAGRTGPQGDGLFLDLRVIPPQLVVRLLNREIWTLNWLVDRLAGADVNARSAWKLRLSNFVDATIAAAIDDACFDFPGSHPFWGMFTTDQAREIARGLAALGYRYDGFGEFLDGRVPDQRDLALALGSAGLYPVRIRYWPKAGEYAELYRNLHVASAVFLATRAPSLTLGELVIALGRRAELLADLWNEWSRARSLLLANPIS